MKEKTADLLPDLPMDLLIRSFASARPNPYKLRRMAAFPAGVFLTL
jgi:hypothetical protein